MSLGGALSDFKESKKSDSGSITILEALTTILPGWDECLVNKVKEVLREKEIRIMTSSPVAKFENGGSDGIDVCLSGDGESKIHSSLTI